MGPQDLNADTWERCDDLWTFGYFLAAPDLCPSPPAGRKFRLLVAAALRQLWPLITDPRLRRAVEAAEQCADTPSPDLMAAADGDAERAYKEAAEGAYPDAVTHDRAELLARGPWQLLAENLNDDPEYPFWRYIIQGLEDEIIPRSQPDEASAIHLALFRDIMPNPFRPVTFNPAWRSSTAVSLAQAMYESRDFAAMPVLADALEEAGCDHPDVLAHCRNPAGVHVRGCWVVDLVLGKA